MNPSFQVPQVQCHQFPGPPAVTDRAGRWTGEEVTVSIHGLSSSWGEHSRTSMSLLSQFKSTADSTELDKDLYNDINC